MCAFRAAIDAGADMCELDVQLSRDGAIVVIHDDSVERTTDGKGEVAELTLEELKRLDAGAKFKSGPFKDARIPTLDEVFAVTSGKCGLNIELKAGGLEHQVAQIMQARNAPRYASCRASNGNISKKSSSCISTFALACLPMRSRLT